MTERPPDGSAAQRRSVARREYVEKLRSRSFAVATAILMAVAIGAALIPIGLRALDRGSLTRIGVVSGDPAVTARVISLVSGYLNPVPPGVDPATVRPHYVLTARRTWPAAWPPSGPATSTACSRCRSWPRADSTSRSTATTGRRAPRSSGCRWRPSGRPWSSTRRPSTIRAPAAGFHLPSFELQPTGGGSAVAPLDAAATGSRTLLASVLIVADLPDPDGLRDVGRHQRRGREGQPGHGAPGQRRHPAPAARRQGPRRGRSRPDPVPGDSRAGRGRPRPPGSDRDGPDRAGRSRARRRWSA